MRHLSETYNWNLLNPKVLNRSGFIEHWLSFSPVNTWDVNDDIDHITAELVWLHVHWRAVRGDVDLTDHIEQERFLNPRILKREQYIDKYALGKLLFDSYLDTMDFD